jgi:4-carboxymuconolactone decarboxylase
LARIPLFPQPDMSPDQARVYETIIGGKRGAIIGPLRVALHRAELADKWQQLGELLRFRTSLSPRLSELAILITARHWDSQFEWLVHEPIAIQAGLRTDAAAAIKNCQRPTFEHTDEETVYDYVTELFDRHQVSDKVYQRALVLLDSVGIVELTALVGYYSMVALTLNAHEVPLPPEATPPLPPRTRELHIEHCDHRFPQIRPHTNE